MTITYFRYILIIIIAEICNKIRRDLAMFIYIYLNVDECWLTILLCPGKGLNKLQILLNYAVIPEHVISED